MLCFTCLFLLLGRDEHSKAIHTLQKEIDENKKAYDKLLCEMEMNYEKRLAQETLYFQRMKQSYDEFVTHARMDLQQAQLQAEMKEKSLLNEKNEVLSDTEKQKHQLLQYCEYVSSRHQELLESLEHAQCEERFVC